MNTSWNICRAEGGFIVYVTAPPTPEQDEMSSIYDQPQPRVFTDTAALLNFLHNELVGSN